MTKNVLISSITLDSGTDFASFTPFMLVIVVLTIEIKLLRPPKKSSGNEQNIESKKEKFMMIKRGSLISSPLFKFNKKLPSVYLPYLQAPIIPTER